MAGPADLSLTVVVPGLGCLAVRHARSGVQEIGSCAAQAGEVIGASLAYLRLSSSAAICADTRQIRVFPESSRAFGENIIYFYFYIPNGETFFSKIKKKKKRDKDQEGGKLKNYDFLPENCWLKSFI